LLLLLLLLLRWRLRCCFRRRWGLIGRGLGRWGGYGRGCGCGCGFGFGFKGSAL
jgi:hypothetical protein